jgi:hypothetical protein
MKISGLKNNLALNQTQISELKADSERLISDKNTLELTNNQLNEELVIFSFLFLNFP